MWDMLRAIDKIQAFTAGLSYQEYIGSDIVRSAVERQFEVLGEAAVRLSNELREEYSSIDWKSIIGLRNILIHQYEKVKHDIVWNIITESLEPLKKQLAPLLPPLPEDEQQELL